MNSTRYHTAPSIYGRLVITSGHEEKAVQLNPTLLQKLEKSLRAAWQRPFYHRFWGAERIEDVCALLYEGRFHELPITRKQHLRDHRAEIMNFNHAADLVSSSGTTGVPVDIPVYPEDEASRILRVRRLLRELGVGPGTRVLQLLSLNDLFTLGPLVWQAIKAQGACAIRCSPQRLDRVLLAIEHARPEFVVGNPFTMVRMAETAGDRWPDQRKLPSRAFLAVAAVFNADLALTPVAEAVRHVWGLEETINQYGSSELGPIAFECSHHQGLHIHDDIHYVELVNPDTGEAVTEPNQPGEVVLTGLSLPRGFIPIRHGTGDVAAWLCNQPCTCGRRSPRLGPIIGRVDHQLKVYGQTVFPDLLLDIVDRCPDVHRSAVCVRRDAYAGDDVSVLIVPANKTDGDQLQNQVADRLDQNLAVSPTVTVIDESTLADLEKMASHNSNQVKIPRFFDLRNKEVPA